VGWSSSAVGVGLAGGGTSTAGGAVVVMGSGHHGHDQGLTLGQVIEGFAPFERLGLIG
jgi:hypothetical protein